MKAIFLFKEKTSTVKVEIFNCGDAEDDFRLSLVSPLVNAANCSFRADNLKQKICSSKLGRFLLFNSQFYCVNCGDAENRTRVQTSG
jgi:hypothetical protein